MTIAMKTWARGGIVIGLAAAGCGGSSAPIMDDAGSPPPQVVTDAGNSVATREPTPPPTDSGTLRADVMAPVDAGEDCTQTLIYMVGFDSNDAGVPSPTAQLILYSFDPKSASLAHIGPIPCLAGMQDSFDDWGVNGDCWIGGGPGLGGCGLPMAVDSSNVAWLFLPNHGESPQVLQKVSIKDGTCIGGAVTVGGLSSSNDEFVGGSAFVSTGGVDKLYVSVSTWDTEAALQLGVFDPTISAVTGLATVSGLASSEVWWWGNTLASDDTGDLFMADWWDGVTDDALVEIDPTATMVTKTRSLPDSLLAPIDEKWGSIMAFWKGSLYFFTPNWWNDAPLARPVMQYELADASVTQVTPDLGAYVFGATSGAACTPAAPSMPAPVAR